MPVLRLPDVPQRVPHLVVEIGRFMVTGGLATITSVALFNFLAHGLYVTDHPWLVAHVYTAFVVANVAGMLVSYQLSRHWTFQHRPPTHADGGRTAFFVINVVTMPLAIVCLWFSRHALGLSDPLSDNLSGNVVGQLIGQAARFYLFRKYVFRQPVTRHDLANQPVSLLGPARQLLEPRDAAGEDRL